MIPQTKRNNLEISANHDPSGRHCWSQGVHLRQAISPCPDQLETCGLDHSLRQELFFLSTKFHPSRTSPREMGIDEPRHSISHPLRPGGVWIVAHRYLSYMAQKAEISCKYLLTHVATCYEGHYL